MQLASARQAVVSAQQFCFAQVVQAVSPGAGPQRLPPPVLEELAEALALELAAEELAAEELAAEELAAEDEPAPDEELEPIPPLHSF